MIALALTTLTGVAFGHIMKLAGHRHASLLWVAAVNYFFASIVCSLAMLVVRPTGNLPFSVATGAWGGVCYLVSLLFFFAAIKRVGMGLATSANRIAIAVPVAVALVVWHESLRAEQIAGLILVAAALPLLGNTKHDGGPREHGVFVRILVPLFAVTGAGQISNAVFNNGAPANNQYLFMATLFGAAGLCAVAVLWTRPERPHVQDLWLGLLLGGVNAVTSVFLLIALRQLPSAVVFSTTSTASVILAAVTGVLIWGERLTRPAIAGIVCAAVAVVLLTV